MSAEQNEFEYTPAVACTRLLINHYRFNSATIRSLANRINLGDALEVESNPALILRALALLPIIDFATLVAIEPPAITEIDPNELRFALYEASENIISIQKRIRARGIVFSENSSIVEVAEIFQADIDGLSEFQKKLLQRKSA